MSVIETLTFELASHVTPDEFLRLDEAVQEDFAYQQPGLERRTTARSSRGRWMVVTSWGDEASAERALAASDVSEPVARWRAAVDLSSLQQSDFFASM
jgi:hypothetical protein